MISSVTMFQVEVKVYKYMYENNLLDDNEKVDYYNKSKTNPILEELFNNIDFKSDEEIESILMKELAKSLGKYKNSPNNLIIYNGMSYNILKECGMEPSVALDLSNKIDNGLIKENDLVLFDSIIDSLNKSTNYNAFISEITNIIELSSYQNVKHKLYELIDIANEKYNKIK